VFLQIEYPRTKKMPVYQIIDNQDNLGLSSGFPCTVPMQEMSVFGIRDMENPAMRIYPG